MYSVRTNKPKMKHLLTLSLLLPFAFVTPTQAQQVNVYAESYCYTNIEQYVPGYYNAYGNYVGGYVNRTRNRVPCGENVVVNQQPYYNNGGGYYRQRTCNPNNAAYGAALGYGLGEALGGGNGWKSSSNWTRNRNSGSYNYSNRNYKSNGWSIFGAGIGALIFGC
jgi:hypothetical protein